MAFCFGELQAGAGKSGGTQHHAPRAGRRGGENGASRPEIALNSLQSGGVPLVSRDVGCTQAQPQSKPHGRPVPAFAGTTGQQHRLISLFLIQNCRIVTHLFWLNSPFDNLPRGE